MARVYPPADCPSADGPKLARLPAGSAVWRIHGSTRAPVEFSSIGAIDKRRDSAAFGAQGRYDCQEGEYGYLYAGETQRSAVAEAFLRGPAVAHPAARFVLRSQLRPRILSRLVVTADLSLVDLRGDGLARIGQDAWLTSCDEVDYPISQAWATAMRRWSPMANGFLWWSKRDNNHTALVLFDDRGTAGRLNGLVRRRFEAGRDLDFLVRILADLNVTVGAP